MTLESQYKEFIQQNPDYSHWDFNEWLKFHNEKLGEIIKEIEQRERINLHKD